MPNTTALPFRTAALLLVAIIGTLSGCGEGGLFSRVELSRHLDESAGSAIDSTQATLSYLSTQCGDAAAAPCPKGMAPAVEIHIEDRSVIFDFSNVSEPGTFADVDFEGFALEIAAEASTPILLARIDTDVTNVDIGDDALTYDRGGFDVNFAAVAYDSSSLVKIDLLAAPLNLFGRGR
jgi:hypothetical protein